MSRLLLVVSVLGSSVVAGAATATNDTVVLVTHAIPFLPGGTCSTPETQGFDCETQGATVSVDPATDVEVYVYAFAADSLAAVAVRFDWDSSWSFTSWQSGCQTNEIAVMTPSASGDSFVAAFDCNGTSGLVPLGRLRMVSGSVGTFLTLGQAAGPDGTAVVSCAGAVSAVPSSRWGSIGVSIEGLDACDAVPGWGGGTFLN